MDDQFLYVACWGTGEMRQYNVTDPRKPKLAGSVHIGGIARRTAHPSGKPYAGGPQMVEISRDGRRVYWTNSLYSTWDNQFYPDGVPGAEVMANASPNGGLELAKNYWVSFPDGYRAHQIRLEGATAQRIHSATRRSEVGRSGLDSCGALAGRRGERPISRGEPRDGLATRGFSWIDEKKLARSRPSALRAWRRSPTCDAGGDASFCGAGRSRRMAAPHPDWRQPSGNGVRHLPARQSSPSPSNGAYTTNTTGTLVVCRGNRPWRGIYVGADLSRALPGR